MTWLHQIRVASDIRSWLRDGALVMVLGLLIPLGISYWLVSSPFTLLLLLRYASVGLFLLFAFRKVADRAPWTVRLVMSMILGQVILNYGFSNMVVGVGGAKITLAEGGVILGLIFLLPSCFSVLRQLPVFWVCLAAMFVPTVIHIYSGVQRYGLAAMRDLLSVVDLVYFLAGMAVVAHGVTLGRWTAWRGRFLKTWIIVGVLYACTTPYANYIQAYSPSMSGYQQSLAILGHGVTMPLTAIIAVAAWYTMPFVYPSNPVLRNAMGALVFVGTLVVVGVFQFRNLYFAIAILPFLLAMFGYRKAFIATLAGVVVMVAALGVMESSGIKVQGRLSQVTLSAMVDRVLSISGKSGDRAGAHGVNQRLGWWASALDRWSYSPDTILFGVGYGMPLTDFVSPGGDDGRGVVVREPHNSYISSLTRGGLVYFCLWGYVILAPLWAAAKGARLKALSAEAGGQYKGVAAWSVVTMFMILAQAFSEPNFEIPSIAAMYYFVAGMAMMEYVTITGRVRYPMAEPRP